MTVFHKAPWRQQPQFLCGIDWDNPNTKNLIGAFLPLSRWPGTEVITQKTGDFEYGIAETLPVGVGGFCFSKQNYQIIKAPLIAEITYNSSVSIAALIYVRSAEALGLGGVRTTGGSTHSLLSANADGTISFFCYGYTGSSTTITSTATLTPGFHVLIGTRVSGTDKWQSLYLDGGLVAEGLPSDPYVSGGGSLVIGGDFGAGRLSATSAIYVHGIFVWKSALHQTTVRSLSDSPWQIFEPLQRRIWVPGVSGGPTYTLTVDSASVPITTTAVGLNFNRALAVSAADVPIALTDVGLNFNRTLAVGSASVPISLADVGLNFNRALSVESAAVPISLSDVTLTYTPASGATYTLTVDPATVPVTLTDVGALFNRALAVDSASVPITTTPVDLSYTRALVVDSASVQVQTTDVGLKFNRALAVDTASILIDLKDVTLTFGAASNFTQEELDEILAYVEANLTIPTVEEISQAVWAYVTRSLTAQGNTDIAAGILTAAQATPIHSDVRKVVGITVDGAGTEGDPWGPA